MTTRELFWKRALGQFREEDAVEWACQQLVTAPPTPNLAALAGLAPLYNGFEIEDLLRRALRELDLPEPSQEAAYRDFICAMARGILDGEISELEGCHRLAEAHRDDMARVELQPFWLLDLALEEELAELARYYDPRFTRDNFEELVRQEATHLAGSICQDKAL